MNPESDMNPVAQLPVLPGLPPIQPPAMIAAAGAGANFAWGEFFEGRIRNRHTRRNYLLAVRTFLAWAQARGLALQQVTPAALGRYLDEHPGSPPTKKLHLAGIRAFFDQLVLRHVIVLNPANSVRGPRYQTVEGKTPEIPKPHIRRLLASIETDTIVGLRDKAVVCLLIYTAVRVGAIAALNVGDVTHDGECWSLRLLEKGGKSREIPLRSHVGDLLHAYTTAAQQQDAASNSPLFTTSSGRGGRLSKRRISEVDICRMVKRRLRRAELPDRYSPHSFRVATITDLLLHGAELNEVQHLAGHADPRTTSLYDRRQKRVTRNIVERITI